MERIGSALASGRWARSSTTQLAAVVTLALLVFALAYLALSAALAGATDRTDADPTRTGSVPEIDSLAPRIAAGRVAVAAPPQGAEALLQQTEVGDRLDVIAVYPATSVQPVLSAVIIRGAVVLRRPPDTSGSPIILEVSPEDAATLTHVVQAGRHVVYTLWPAGNTPPPAPAVDIEALRIRLGAN